MIASYILSSTFVPVMSVWLLRTNHRVTEDTEPRHTERSHRNHVLTFFSSSLWFWLCVLCDSVVRSLVRLRWLVVPAYIAAVAALVYLAGRPLGTEIFPTVDAGQFQMRLRAPTGTRIE